MQAFSTSTLRLRQIPPNGHTTDILAANNSHSPNEKEKNNQSKRSSKKLKFRHKFLIFTGLTGLSAWLMGKYYPENSDLEKTVSFLFFLKKKRRKKNKQKLKIVKQTKILNYILRKNICFMIYFLLRILARSLSWNYIFILWFKCLYFRKYIILKAYCLINDLFIFFWH